MDEEIQEKIINVVHKEQGWKTQEVRIDEVERLRNKSCSFYTAGHTVRPLSYQLNYAVLPGDTVISLADKDAVNKILQACGADATPTWWAEIITRFHQELGSGVVLTDPQQNTGATAKIEAVKKEFAPPKFHDEPEGKSVSFYSLEPEAFIVYSVKATVSKEGKVTVEKTEL